MLTSAGILVYRIKSGKIEVLLGKTGGPFWKKIKRSWQIPKGRVEEGESLEETARREFFEETGIKIEENIEFLGEVKSKLGKLFKCYFLEKDFGWDEKIPETKPTVEIKFKNKNISFKEIESLKYFDINEAKKVIYEYQVPLLEALERKIKNND
jgi:predicted NUDIX family NTP pyrophosphohydrolase